MPESSGEDALARLRDQVRAASETATRVAEEAAKVATGSDSGSGAGSGSGSGSGSSSGIPRAGYAVPGSARAGATNPEIQALVGLIEVIRELIPEDLQQQIVELVRELLALLRAVVDLVIARMEREAPTPTPVEDIPIG